MTTETFAIDINLMGDRIYIPSIHSFTTLDPTFNGGTSPYNYANADPINLNDPTGNAPEANILEGGFWDVNNPYMWILGGSLAAGVISGGVLAGYTVGFLAGLVITVVVAGTVGFFAGFTYGMITTDDDWGASATMGLIGMGYGAGGAALGFTATYALTRLALSTSEPGARIASVTEQTRAKNIIQTQARQYASELRHLHAPIRLTRAHSVSLF